MGTASHRRVVVVLSGAGISRESGLKTFRDGDGLWEQHRVEDVATPEAWARDPEMVLRFYDQRRLQLDEVGPNAAHRVLAGLEEEFDVRIVTQNVDDLHERAGSTHVLHLHGELRKVRPEDDPGLDESGTFIVGGPEVPGPSVAIGDTCPRGVQLRPHVVWFGEAVPMLDRAAEVVSQADELLVVGTSMQVYPAAGLIHFAPAGCHVAMVNPDEEAMAGYESVVSTFIQASASEGVARWAAGLRQGP